MIKQDLIILLKMKIKNNFNKNNSCLQEVKLIIVLIVILINRTYNSNNKFKRVKIR